MRLEAAPNRTGVTSGLCTLKLDPKPTLLLTLMPGSSLYCRLLESLKEL